MFWFKGADSDNANITIEQHLAALDLEIDGVEAALEAQAADEESQTPEVLLVTRGQLTTWDFPAFLLLHV